MRSRHWKSLFLILAIGSLCLLSQGCKKSQQSEAKFYLSYSLGTLFEARKVIQEDLRTRFPKCVNKKESKGYSVSNGKLVEYDEFEWHISVPEDKGDQNKKGLEFSATIKLIPPKDSKVVFYREFIRNDLEWTDSRLLSLANAPSIEVKKENGKWQFTSTYTAPKSSCGELMAGKPVVEDLYSTSELEEKRKLEGEGGEQEDGSPISIEGDSTIEVCEISGLLPAEDVCLRIKKRFFSANKQPTEYCSSSRH